MYEELIRGLRDKAEFLRKASRYSSPHNSFAETMSQAADAIEELVKAKDKLSENVAHWEAEVVKSDCDAWLAENADATRWIPVTERLPEEPYGCLAVVWDNPRYGDGDMFLNYYPEFIGWDGETWNDADGEEIPFDVVYWMRLPQIPEPPKEE